MNDAASEPTPEEGRNYTAATRYDSTSRSGGSRNSSILDARLGERGARPWSPTPTDSETSDGTKEESEHDVLVTPRHAEALAPTAPADADHGSTCEDDFEQAALQTILARQDYLKNKIEAQDTTVDLLVQGQLEQLIHRKGGSITTMLYADRLEEVCETARVAIEKSAVHYKVHRGTQPLLD